MNGCHSPVGMCPSICSNVKLAVAVDSLRRATTVGQTEVGVVRWDCEVRMR